MIYLYKVNHKYERLEPLFFASTTPPDQILHNVVWEINRHFPELLSTEDMLIDVSLCYSPEYLSPKQWRDNMRSCAKDIRSLYEHQNSKNT